MSPPGLLILDGDIFLAGDAAGQARAIEAVQAHRCVEPASRKL